MICLLDSTYFNLDICGYDECSRVPWESSICVQLVPTAINQPLLQILGTWA